MGYGGFPILEERNEEVYSMQYIMLYNPAEAPGGDIILGEILQYRRNLADFSGNEKWKQKEISPPGGSTAAGSVV